MKYSLKNNLKLLALAVLLGCQQPSESEDVLNASNSPSDKEIISELIRSAKSNSTDLDSLWNQAVDRRLVPYTFKDSIFLFYKGDAEKVVWNGDFNSWGGNRDFNNQGKKLGESDLWLLEASFPENARLDYKIVVDDQWILDPANPHHQWTGVGGGSPNSAILMPEYKVDSLSFRKPSQPGQIHEQHLIASKFLDYEVAYQVYTPFGYDDLTNLPLLILTDGHEFLHEKLGDMKDVIDNLIEQGKIKPVIVAFVDPRSTEDPSQNRRMSELALNENYVSFLTEELIPSVKDTYRTSDKREDHAIGGVSLGGLNAAYALAVKPDHFSKAAIMSPAFWYKPEIYELWKGVNQNDFKIYLSSGTINDAAEDSQKFYELIRSKDITVKYDTIPQGHSWGNWRDLSDEMLIYLFANKE